MAIPRRDRPISTALRVFARSRAVPRGVLWVGRLPVPCALGRSGRSFTKREGDGATPSGRWHLMGVFYRADRMKRPCTALPTRALRPDDGWCDAVGDRNYNRAVRHPYPVSAERLWRSDHLYDVIVVLNHNVQPRIQGAGSAIFIHLARPGYRPTEGCIALSRHHLLMLLARVGRRSILWIA